MRQGYQREEVGELYYAQSRRYDAVTGRFISKDLDKFMHKEKFDFEFIAGSVASLAEVVGGTGFHFGEYGVIVGYSGSFLSAGAEVGMEVNASGCKGCTELGTGVFGGGLYFEVGKVWEIEDSCID